METGAIPSLRSESAPSAHEVAMVFDGFCLLFFVVLILLEHGRL